MRLYIITDFYNKMAFYAQYFQMSFAMLRCSAWILGPMLRYIIGQLPAMNCSSDTSGRVPPGLVDRSTIRISFFQLCTIPDLSVVIF